MAEIGSPRELFVHDVGAAFFPFADDSPAFRALDLTGAGLEWRNARVESCHPAPDGTCALTVSPSCA